MPTATNPSKLNAQQRAALFLTATRQTVNMLPKRSVIGENQTIQFDIPKTRLLSKIRILVDAVVKLTSTNASIPLSKFSPYEIIRRVELNLNNGFKPFTVSGRDLYMYSVDRLNPDVLDAQNTSKRGINYVENAASAAPGTNANVHFVLELPVTLNDRDPVGLVLLQNAESSITLSLDIDTMVKAYQPAAGDTVVFQTLTVQPQLETYSIPPIQDAFPDLSILKIVQSKADSFSGNGQNIIKLLTGTIYRKLLLYFEDENGNPLTNADFLSEIELVFNTADTPYSISADALSAWNHSQLGYPLTDGLFLFDFSFQGLPNLGGSRDYVDTEKLTEFWVKFNTQKAGKLTAIFEQLSRLQ